MANDKLLRDPPTCHRGVCMGAADPEFHTAVPLRQAKEGVVRKAQQYTKLRLMVLC